MRADLCQSYPGFTFDTIDNMSFEQIADLCSEGKTNQGIKTHSIEEVMDIQRNWRKYAGI